MFRLNNIKQNVLILSFATLLAGCGGEGTATTTDSTSTDLTTTSTAKVVKIDVSAITTEDSATIEWNPYGYTTKSVEYGTSNKYGSVVSVQEEGTVTLYNLQANTEYHYRIVSEDEKGRPVVSNDMTFTTLAASNQPIVTDPVPTDPIITEPAPTDTNATEPTVTDPVSTEPIVTEAAPTVTEPVITDPIVTEPIVEETQAVCIEGDAKIEGHVTDKDTGTGLVGVQVNIGGCVTTTDSQGDYILMNIAVSDKASVMFSAEGYYTNSTNIQITDLSPNYTTVEIDKYISQWTYDSQTLVSGAHIVIPSGVYINHDGSPYIGQVTAGLSYRNSTEKGSEIVFPGEYKGEDNYGNIVPFISYGFTVIDLTDESGNALSVADDITLIFEATGAPAESIPLWFYDYEQGTWIEEGYATRLADGTYEGTVSHPGTWSLSQPIEDASGIYTDRILYTDGTPVKNLRVHAIGDNWISTDLSTDENGVFEIEVIPGQAFTLRAYHYDDKYGATYNGMISAVAPGETIDNSSL
ncbi:carboxypeptidase regulatory-like domain-containing protein [Sulfurovum sp. TSL1]|uniref:carboxypeptidase regulatory-like domain-containing protein n=1 Tax=Sulfurovum sp. TSL1 TaxID=2826994 RepID=UPI001CC52D6D|nr:carboxypeptidase regulatory-like domain-containing protein [Sulfurovum sp. TSL1]GIT98066.1 hypothetical protein TSL1_08870 [Sulfurovum sp. TSL1]